PVLCKGAWRVPLGRCAARDAPVAAPLCEECEDADAGDSRRAGLSGSRHAGAAILQFTEGEGRGGASRLFPRREPLDPEAAELGALVSRVLRVARAIRAGREAPLKAYFLILSRRSAAS